MLIKSRAANKYGNLLRGGGFANSVPLSSMRTQAHRVTQDTADGGMRTQAHVNRNINELNIKYELR